MIVYNVANRFFTMKADANDYRVEQKLPPAALNKLSIQDRVQLAALLDGLCNAEPPAPVTCEANVNIPDFIPKFIARDWEKRRSYAAQR